MNPPSASKPADDRAVQGDLAQRAYEELHRIARERLSRERAGHTLSPTDLVHEAYLRLAGGRPVDWRDRTHFRATAALTMQRVLIDYARRRGTARRGGDWTRVALIDTQLGQACPDVAVTDLQAALEQLERLDRRQARIVGLRLFGGLTATETADVTGVSVRTVDREWKSALAWLKRSLADRNEAGTATR